MDRPIQAGDLVAVVRWPCCGYKLGRTFKVGRIEPSPTGLMRCVNCYARHPTQGDANDSSRDGSWTPLAWLKRIPPLSELEGEKREETVNA